MKTRNHIFVFVLLLIAIFGGRAFAQASGVTISPLARKVSVSPGQTISGTIDATNPLDVEQTFYPIARDFRASSEPSLGTPNFIENTDQAYERGISSWISFSTDKLVIPPRSTRSLSYTLKVSQDASPGGHYGAVFLSTTTPALEKDSGVTLSARFGSLILATVAGDIKASGSLLNFQPARKVFSKSPVTLRYEIENTGNVHLVPAGTINVGRFLKKKFLTHAVNGSQSNVLPESKRIFEEQVDVGKWGRFKANLQLTLSAPDNTQIVQIGEAVFWVLPVKSILIGALVILALVALFRFWLRRHDATLKKGRKK